MNCTFLTTMCHYLVCLQPFFVACYLFCSLPQGTATWYTRRHYYGVVLLFSTVKINKDSYFAQRSKHLTLVSCLSRDTGNGLFTKIFIIWPFFSPTNKPSLAGGPPMTLMYRIRDSMTHSLEKRI